MAASRIDSSYRLCAKYKTFLYIVSVIGIIQLVVGYFFLNTGREPDSYSGSKKKQILVPGVDRGDQLRHGAADGGTPPQIEIKARCAITSTLAKSAIQRATTQACKQSIADVTCRAQRGQLYPKKVPNYCPKKKQDVPVMLGCFRDVADDRDLEAHSTSFSYNTPQTCINHCFAAGFSYAGVQFGRECWCDNNYGKHGRLPATACDSKCSGNASLHCGGYLSANVWTTQLHDKVFNPADLVDPVTVAEHDRIRIVYLLSVNGRAVRQVYRLIKAIYHVNHYFYIHVDKRQEYLYRELLPLPARYHNIRLTSWRMATIWGGASLLQMHLRALDDLLNMDDWDWDFYVNLSESDYPIKSNDYLTSFLTKYRNQNFVKSFGFKRGADFIKKQGLEKTFFECDTHMWRLGDRDLPAGIIMDGGSDWLALSRSFSQYVLTSQDGLVQGLKRMYAYTLLPAESIFHTILHNSVYCDRVVNNNLHITNWQRKKGCRCQYKHVVDWCGCSPNVYLSADFPKILAQQTKPVFFARKFEAVIDQDVINKVDAWIYGPYSDDGVGVGHYWENVWHHEDVENEHLAEELTHANAYSRFATNQHNHVNKRDPGCHLKVLEPLEITLYHKDDNYQGLLIMYRAQHVGDSSKQYVVEAFIQPENFYTVHSSDGASGRLVRLQVGTKFDPKELIFRNYASVMSPLSPVEMMYTFAHGPKFTLTVVWVDPTQQVAGYYNIVINVEKVTSAHKPDLKRPLQPGGWTVKLYHKSQLIAQTKFVILPLVFDVNGELLMDKNVAARTNSGSQNHYPPVNLDHLQLNLVKQTLDPKRHLVGEELLSYADDLLAPFWRIRSMCHLAVNEQTELTCPSVMACSLSDWSSRTPDLKSTLGPINGITGGLR